MKAESNQLDFNFSRPIDFQKNLNFPLLTEKFEDFFPEKKSNHLFVKHLRLIIVELYHCWSESENQYLTVSMSKRGYKSKSRYNPNRISSQLIMVVKYLSKLNLIDLHKGFYDSKRKISRLTRIRASRRMIVEFMKINLGENIKINHAKREFLYLQRDKRNLLEYADNFRSHEIRDVLVEYNDLISKSLFDMPCESENYILRTDKKKISIARTNSYLNYRFLGDFYGSGYLEGCWWNRLDLITLKKKKEYFLINHGLTNHINLMDICEFYLSKKLNQKINIKFSSMLDNLDKEQKLHLILKGMRSKDFDSFCRSLMIEKEKIGLRGFDSILKTKSLIQKFIRNNNSVSNFFFRGIDSGWTEFVSLVFFFLIKNISGSKIPVYLANSYLFYPEKMEQRVLQELVKILESLLKVPKLQIKIHKCYSYNFKKRGFFSSVISKNREFSDRYLKIKKMYRNL